MTNEQFIQEIAVCAQNAYKIFGKPLPSVCIGMACVECAYGRAGSVKHHSYMGQKVGTGKTATRYWPGTFFTSKTKEEYTIGTHTVIQAAFRSYESMQQCILNYYELLNTRLYAKVQAGADYATQMKQIKACGYMTSSTEVNSVISIIKKYGLTKYDNVANLPSASAQEAKDVRYAVLLKSDMNVRAGAGTDNQVLFVLPKGMVIAVAQEKNGWGRIADIQGWISLSSKYVAR